MAAVKSKLNRLNVVFVVGPGETAPKRRVCFVTDGVEDRRHVLAHSSRARIFCGTVRLLARAAASSTLSISGNCAASCTTVIPYLASGVLISSDALSPCAA